MMLQAREVEYDIVGHPQANFSFAVTFPFHPYPDRPGGEVRLVNQHILAVSDGLYGHLLLLRQCHLAFQLFTSVESLLCDCII